MSDLVFGLVQLHTFTDILELLFLQQGLLRGVNYRRDLANRNNRPGGGSESTKGDGEVEFGCVDEVGRNVFVALHVRKQQLPCNAIRSPYDVYFGFSRTLLHVQGKECFQLAVGVFDEEECLVRSSGRVSILERHGEFQNVFRTEGKSAGEWLVRFKAL